MKLDTYVTDDEVAEFLRQEPVWPPIFTLFRALTRGTPSAEGLSAQECGREALRALEVLGAPDPERLQNIDLPCALALMYTHSGLKQVPSDSDLRSALYLLRPIATLKGGSDHPDWHAGLRALMLASYLNQCANTGWHLGTRDLMDRLSRICLSRGTIIADRSQVERARSGIIAARCYPTVREQLKKEWEYLEQLYRERRSFYDTDRRAGHLYLDIKKLGLPNLEAVQGRGKCYVATFVYGAESGEVELLRQFRDDVMIERWRLSWAVALYYEVSPILIRRFGGSAWFRSACTRALGLVVHAVEKHHRPPIETRSPEEV